MESGCIIIIYTRNVNQHLFHDGLSRILPLITSKQLNVLATCSTSYFPRQVMLGAKQHFPSEKCHVHVELARKNDQGESWPYQLYHDVGRQGEVGENSSSLIAQCVYLCTPDVHWCMTLSVLRPGLQSREGQETSY